MRLSGNLTPISTGVLSINRTLQNGSHSGKNTNVFASPFQVDRVSISPQGKAASIIDTLNKQKMAIEERKSNYMSAALEKGQSMDSIQAQLDSYDEQIKEIDKQIAEISSKQMEEANEKKNDAIKKSVRDNTPKTEQEIQNQRMQNLMEVSMGVERVDTVDSVKTKIDGDSAVLESEIELDKMRSNGTPGSLEAIAKKEEQLAEMQQHSMELTAEIGEQMADLAEDIQENNEPVEKVDDTENKDSTTKSDDEVSDSQHPNINQSKIEHYEQIQRMAEDHAFESPIIEAFA